MTPIIITLLFPLYIGCGAAIKTIPVPVDYRKRYIYNVYCPNGPGLNCPTVVDPSGAYFRRVGWSNNYLCGSSYSHDVDVTNAEVDFEFFDEKIWPVLGHRAPCFQNLEVRFLHTRKKNPLVYNIFVIL